MEQTKKKHFTLETKAGCRRLLTLLLAIIVTCSLAAQMMSTQGGTIKVEQMAIDSRGATLSGELYYPAGTNDKDRLPAILLTHGAGVTRGNYRGTSEELARRGFVVLSVSGYGTGYSEMPAYDERGMGVDTYDTWTTPSGILDALNYMRTFNFIDQTRIGIMGHSQGSRRAEYATLLDCGYLTYNDIMINVLHDTYGEDFTEAEINMNADELAAARLNKDQLEYYRILAKEKREWFDTRVRSLCLVGSSANNSSPMQTAIVAGHEVKRNCQMNMALINGIYDSTAYVSAETTIESFHINENVNTDTWYVLDDANASSSTVGEFYGSVLDNKALQAALKEHTTRLVSFNVETHSKNFFSKQTTQDIIKYFEQTLNYNGGELGAAGSKPIDASNIIFIWREILNFIAMIAMIALLIPAAGLLLKTKFFAMCEGNNESNPTVYSKKRYWLVNVCAVMFGFVAIYCINKIFAPGLPNTGMFPLFPSWWLAPIFLTILAVFCLVELIVIRFADKKKYGRSFFEGLNIKLNFTNALKSLLMALILFVLAYMTLAVIKYVFNQDYRLWMFSFEELKVEQWADLIKYSILALPQLLIIGAAVNYAPRRDMPEWLDDLLTVVFNSLGVWLCCIINTAIIYSGGKQICNWTSTYGYLLAVPIILFLTRMLYKKTKSIWVGAAVSALILAWQLATTVGYNIYTAQTFITNFFNM